LIVDRIETAACSDRGAPLMGADGRPDKTRIELARTS
jgi:hypothetical protein